MVASLTQLLVVRILTTYGKVHLSADSFHHNPSISINIFDYQLHLGVLSAIGYAIFNVYEQV